MEDQGKDEIHDCRIKPRVNPTRRRDKVYIGCGAGFGGDRPLAALKLFENVKELNYLVLECLAERTLADRYKDMLSGGYGYDSRISEWMHLLLPLAVERGTCIITNMGAIDTIGAQHKVLEIAQTLGLKIVVGIAHEVSFKDSGSRSTTSLSYVMDGGISTYLGAAPIVRCLELYKPHVIITSRVADAALFLGPMVYELGWNWNDVDLLSQGTMAGHLLECGCQLTGGYFMHPGDKTRDFTFSHLRDISLPYAEISYNGEVCVAKADGSGGVINFSTCAQQLLYEIGDPSAYVTPDVVIDIRDVTFLPLSRSKVLCTGAKSRSKVLCTGAKSSAISRPEKLLRLVPKESGWKGWGEISYGGHECIVRAKAAEYLVRSWIEESYSGVSDKIISYIIGFDSLKTNGYLSESSTEVVQCRDIRLRMDGIFELEEHAIQFVREFTALYTNGPAGGGGISTGHRKEIHLEKQLVDRDSVFWHTKATSTNTTNSHNQETQNTSKINTQTRTNVYKSTSSSSLVKETDAPGPAPSGTRIPLYEVAHSRAGDKGNDINFSIIPHYPNDIERLKMVINPQWVKRVVSSLLNPSSFLNQDDMIKRDAWIEENVTVEIYEVRGIRSLNVVVRNILDGGVNCSRRIDRHGKSISDVVLSQVVVLP